ncbi:MAG: riboflavin synthase [Fimbriimonadaceae bacterium]|nr:riboflavin synthase [Fimbriimonadaceae bacterium]
MFTGLVEAVGVVRAFDGKTLRLEVPPNEEPWALGESVAANGCCLTVVEFADGLAFELSGETLSRTTFARLGVGRRVNIERALRVGDRLGGHFVQGHVDAVGRVVGLEPSDVGSTLRVEVPAGGERFLIDKGSIAVDGVSLTVVRPEGRTFEVALVPHTLAATNLGDRKPGDAVHLEYDVLAKHVAKLLEGGDR